MYGKLNPAVAISNPAPGFGEGRIKVEDAEWGVGADLGLLFERAPRTRLGVTWISQANLDFAGPAKFSDLAPGISAILASRRLLDFRIRLGIKVPQQQRGSLFTQIDDRWAPFGSVGWQQWPKFGLVPLGIEDSANPRSLTEDLDLRITWYLALGAQYRLSEPWRLSFGIVYDSPMYSGSNVSPVLPLGSAWRFGAGAEQRLSKDASWGLAAEYVCGGILDVDVTGQRVALGGRGNVTGSYDDVGILFVAAYYNGRF